MIAKTAKRIFNVLNGETKGLHQAALLLGAMGILTKILALLRDRILAANFGAGGDLDIYFAAFRIPDFIFTASLFITSGAALIPLFIKEEKKGREFANIFLGRIFSAFLFFIFFVSLAGYFFAPYAARLIAPGFSADKINILSILMRIMIFSPFFFGLSNIAAVVTQTFQRFFVYALAPLFYNLGIILGVVVFYPRIGLRGLAWGVVFGAALHFLIQAPVFFQLKFLPKPSFNFFSKETREVFLAGLGRTLGLGLNQIVLIILTAIASVFAAGSITVFNLSNNLQSVPLTVVGLSYSLAAFPVLSRFLINDRKEGFFSAVRTASRHIIFWSVFASVLFIVLRAQIVRSVLGAGMFGWTETKLTAACLAIFSVSVAAQSLIILFSRAYYAAEKTARPLAVNAISSIFIVLFALLFFSVFKTESFRNFFLDFFRVQGVADIQVLSLPLAYSLGSIINMAFLWRYFKKDFGFEAGEIVVSARQNLIAAVFLAAVSYSGLRLFSLIFDLDTFWGIFSQGALAGLFGSVTYFATLHFLKNKEFKEISVSLKTKFWKTPVIQEETERLL